MRAPLGAAETLGYEPAVDIDAGLVELAGWLEGRSAVDRADEAARALAERGLSL